jgi:hypothetical protein
MPRNTIVAPTFSRAPSATLVMNERTFKRLMGTVKTIQTVAGSHPQISGLIFVDGINIIIAQAARIAPIVAIMPKDPSLAVETIQTSIRSQPQRAGPILEDGMHKVVAQALGLLSKVLIALKSCRAMLVQAHAR